MFWSKELCYFTLEIPVKKKKEKMVLLIIAKIKQPIRIKKPAERNT